MVISPEAIARFLDTDRPSFNAKELSDGRLHEAIRHVTGVKLQTRTASFHHQLAATAFGLVQRRALLLLQMRLGKSKCALDYIQHLRRAGLSRMKAQIIVPSPVLLDVWERQAELHSELKVRAVGSSYRGTGQDIVDLYLDALESDCDALVVAWSSLQAIFTHKEIGRKTNKPKLYPAWDKLRSAAQCFDVSVFDEIHTAKNSAGLYFKMASALVEASPFRLGLTGTPSGRNPFDLWAQAFLMDGGATLGRNFVFFKEAFGTKKKNWFAPGGVELVFDPDKLPVLNRKLQSLAISYRTAECMDIPVVRRGDPIQVRMHGRQREAYNDAVNKFIKLRAGDTQEIDAIFVRLRQISSGYVGFNTEDGEKGSVVFPENPKLEWLEEELLQLECQAIIFHEFTKSGDMICRLLEKMKIRHSWLQGKTRDKPGEISRFQDGGAQIIVVQNQTGYQGIDLSAADWVLFYESPVSPIVRSQAEARAQGNRGSRMLCMDDLVAAPVEQKVLGFLQEGKDVLRELLKQRDALRA